MTAPVNHIGICNRSRGIISDEILAAFVEVYRQEIPEFCRAWDLPVPGIALYPSTHQQDPAEEALIFVVNSANDPSAFGAHSQLGRYVWAYVDGSLCLDLQEPLSRVLGHEIFEMIADPGLDRWMDVGGGERVALEVADPCQRYSTSRMGSFMGHSAIVELADWVTPAFYRHGAPGPYDRMGVITAPLTVATGGYLTKRSAGAAIVEGARVTSFGRTFRRLQRAMVG